MRVIVVIDLEGGTAVHALPGPRARYRRLRSVLGDGADPVAVARAARARLGLDELYVADLPAIERGMPPHPAIGALAHEARVLVDAGVADADRALDLLRHGADGVVVGTETLPEAAALARIRAALPGRRVVLSLDVRAGRVVARAPDLRGLPPAEALARLAGSVDEAIVLALDRVGTNAGPDVALLERLHRTFPRLALLAGGGVRDARDLAALRDAGADGALVGTALHRGAIGRRELAAFESGGSA